MASSYKEISSQEKVCFNLLTNRIWKNWKNNGDQMAKKQFRNIIL